MHSVRFSGGKGKGSSHRLLRFFFKWARLKFWLLAMALVPIRAGNIVQEDEGSDRSPDAGHHHLVSVRILPAAAQRGERPDGQAEGFFVVAWAQLALGTRSVLAST